MPESKTMVKEKFYFKMAKECLKENRGIIMDHETKIARKTTGIVILAIGVAVLLNIINGFFINANIINAIIAIKNRDKS